MVDNHGGNLGSAATITSGVRVELRLAVKGQDATGWYRVTTPASHVRAWTQLHATTSLTLNGSTSVTNRVLVRGEASSAADWFCINYIVDGADVATVGQSMADDVTLPDHLFARSLPAANAAWVNDSVSIKGLDGPILRGVEMSMEVTHPRPLESVLPFVQPNPRTIWRSASASADQQIVLLTTTTYNGGSEISHMGNDVLGFYFAQCNAQNIRVETLNVGGTWDVLVDIVRAETGLATASTSRAPSRR